VVEEFVDINPQASLLGSPVGGGIILNMSQDV
jgi:hypothetical protein